MVDEIAKYLAVEDLLAARLVSSSWTVAFERTFDDHGEEEENGNNDQGEEEDENDAAN